MRENGQYIKQHNTFAFTTFVLKEPCGLCFLKEMHDWIKKTQKEQILKMNKYISQTCENDYTVHLLAVGIVSLV